MSCDKMPASLIQMLAAALLVDNLGRPVGINAVIEKPAQPCKGEQLINCDTNLTNLEGLVVANAFTVDTCGKPALKIYLNDAI